MQPQTHPMAPMAPNSPANITTEQIQKYLDENKQLIFAIMDNQNLGKLAECAQYQAQLQKNLLYLAAIADAQPPTSTIRPQMVPHPPMQQGNPFGQQTPAFHPRPPLQFSSQPIHEQQQQQYQPQQMFPGHMGIRPGPSMPFMHVQPSHVRSSELPPGPSTGGGNKHDVGKLIAANTPGTGDSDGQRSSGIEHGSGEAAKPPSIPEKT